MQNNQNKEINENEHTYDNGFHPKEVHLKPNYNLYRKSLGFKIWNKIVIYSFVLFMFIPKYIFWGIRVKGKKSKWTVVQVAPKKIKQRVDAYKLSKLTGHITPTEISELLRSCPFLDAKIFNGNTS